MLTKCGNFAACFSNVFAGSFVIPSFAADFGLDGVFGRGDAWRAAGVDVRGEDVGVDMGEGPFLRTLFSIVRVVERSLSV
jgi:hypothetical protein